VTLNSSSEEPLQYKRCGCKIIYCILANNAFRGGWSEGQAKVGDILAYFLINCAFGGGGRLAVSKRRCVVHRGGSSNALVTGVAAAIH
jgi:hypothetical protein